MHENALCTIDEADLATTASDAASIYLKEEVKRARMQREANSRWRWQNCRSYIWNGAPSSILSYGPSSLRCSLPHSRGPSCAHVPCLTFAPSSYPESHLPPRAPALFASLVSSPLRYTHQAFRISGPSPHSRSFLQSSPRIDDT